MKKILLGTAITFAFATGAFADAGHAKKPGMAASMMEIGAPGAAAKVDRTINVTLLENDEGQMLIKSDDMSFKSGETIRFNITNKGELEHEFVLDTVERNAEHKIEMAKMDMEHDDPNRIRLEPGASGEVVWTFANAGTFEAACLIAGHYESGMYREVSVGDQMAQADLKYSKGTIKKIDAKAGKVTVDHGPLVNLEMPSMTMVFRADKDMIATMSEGQAIEFVEGRVNGKVTIVTLK